jgi:hypothetical protein
VHLGRGRRRCPCTSAAIIIRPKRHLVARAERAVQLQRPLGDVVQHLGIATFTAAMSLRTCV